MVLNFLKIGEGKPLIFFHGWGFDHRIWFNLAFMLLKQYQLYLVDLPGFGLSSLMSWKLFKQKLLRELPETFAVVGWSMGGLFATRLAVEEPERLTHLINIASTPYFIKEKHWSGIEKQVLEQFMFNLSLNPQKTLAHFINLQLENQSSSYKNQHQPKSQGLEYGLKILTEWDLRASLKHFKKPTYYLFGRLDSIIPRTLMPCMQEIFPQFNYLMFPKAAHIPFLSHQNEFIPVLKRALQ